MFWGLRRVSVCAVLALAALAVASLGAGAARARATSSATRASVPRSIELELPLRIDSAGLARFATAVSTPGSPLYRDYESVPALARRFGASAAARTRVVRALRAAGARDVRIDPTGVFADATMSVVAAERLFGTDLAAFRSHAVGGEGDQGFVAPTRAARIPSALRGAVTGVVGLDTRPLGDDAAPRATSSGYSPRTGTAAGCSAAVAQPGFTPNQYLTAYGFGGLQARGVEGQGERVALIEIDGFKASDVRTFASCFHLPLPRIDAYGVGIGRALPAGGESTLDLELLDAAAPKLKEIDVYESEPMASQVLRSLTEPLAARSRIPDVISASLSTCQPDAQAAIGQAGINAVESTLEVAAATGVSVLAASGDDGSTACLTARGAPLPQLAVNYPAASPWVTGVGGTNVQLTAQNAIAGQVVWNDEPTVAGASGGGVSTFRRPAYQRFAQGSSRREVPDVSMLGDPLPGYEIYCSASECLRGAGSNPWINVGGTSAATPLLAGGFALIDQLLRARGQQNLGFANPLLYRVAHSPAAALTISDVTSGTNDISPQVFGRSLGCCNARVGYDDATGLGSVNVSGLASAAETLVPRQVKVGVTLPAQHDELRAAHLLATVSCTTQCLMGAYARIRLGSSRQLVSAYSTPYQLTARRQRTVDIDLTRGVQGQIRSALAAGQPVLATVYGAVIDSSGSIVRQSSPRTLRIDN